MFSERLDDLAAAADGKLVSGRPDMLINGLFTDTRTPLVGGLFLALRGDRFDGHDFARAAVELGAAAVLVDQRGKTPISGSLKTGCASLLDLPSHIGMVLVRDTAAGYLAIAAAHRRKLTGVRWLGVTGSVGKTTTKEMLAHVLEHGAGWSVHKNHGNFNNAVGLPRTILGVSAEDQAAVVELGANRPGEIRQLAAVARPNVAVITCAAETHLEAFKTVENVAREKGEILSFQNADDTAVLNADDPHLPLWRGMAKGKVLSFGAGPQADVRARQLRVDRTGCAAFLACYDGDAVACALSVPGVHQARNALAALAAALAVGVPLEEAVRALASFEGMAGRFSVSTVREFTLIDDAYNASPASFAAALETMMALPAERRFVIAGDMLELGAQAEALHRELGRRLASCDLAGLLTVGGLMQATGEAAVSHGLPRARWTSCPTPQAAAQALRPRLLAGDTVLVKGSHGLHLEECCALLRQ